MCINFPHVGTVPYRMSQPFPPPHKIRSSKDRYDYFKLFIALDDKQITTSAYSLHAIKRSYKF